MINVAALYLLNKNGAFKSSFFVGHDSDLDSSGIISHPKRYKDISNPDDVLESYLGGTCKMTIFGSSNIRNILGTSFKARSKNISAYKNYAQKQIEMIEPPSFLEKLMVINKKVAGTRSGKIAGKVSLGVVPAALTVVALSARAYGASRHFVMDKLNLNQVNKKSFKERLSEIKDRTAFTNDVKKLNRIENMANRSYEMDNLLQQGKNASFAKNKEILNLMEISSSNGLLKSYMQGLVLIGSDGKRVADPDRDHFRSILDASKTDGFPPLKSDDLKADITRHQKAVDMIDPPTKTELKLLKRIKRLKERQQDTSSESVMLSLLNRSVEKTMAKYIAQKEKQDKSFKGNASMFERLSDIEKRNQAQERLNKLNGLYKKLKRNGR